MGSLDTLCRREPAIPFLASHPNALQLSRILRGYSILRDEPPVQGWNAIHRHHQRKQACTSGKLSRHATDTRRCQPVQNFMRAPIWPIHSWVRATRIADRLLPRPRLSLSSQHLAGWLHSLIRDREAGEKRLDSISSTPQNCSFRDSRGQVREGRGAKASDVGNLHRQARVRSQVNRLQAKARLRHHPSAWFAIKSRAMAYVVRPFWKCPRATAVNSRLCIDEGNTLVE